MLYNKIFDDKNGLDMSMIILWWPLTSLAQITGHWVRLFSALLLIISHAGSRSKAHIAATWTVNWRHDMYYELCYMEQRLECLNLNIMKSIYSGIFCAFLKQNISMVLPFNLVTNEKFNVQEEMILRFMDISWDWIHMK